jgi:hypothetical protein
MTAPKINSTTLVIMFVGLTLLGSLVGCILLPLNGQDIPDTLKMIATGALTGLVGLLVPAGRSGT